jgi:carbonic anhydrase
MAKAFAAAALFAALECVELDDSGDFGYDHPGRWANKFPACGGNRQSPIDIATNATQPAQGWASISTKYNTAISDFELENNGHNVGLSGKFGSLTLWDGTYNVVGFHFHFPSEHSIDGELMDGEMHIVHQREGAVDVDGLAVVGILLKKTSKHSKFFEQLSFGDLPDEGAKVSVKGSIALGHLLEKHLTGSYYYYEGSLTTPPCSETAHWFVIQKELKIDEDFVDNFKSKFPDPSNNRPVQNLNGRVVGLKSEATVIV